MAAQKVSPRLHQRALHPVSPDPAGFTIVELLITLVLAAILMTIAVPAYQAYLQRGHRAEAIRLLLEAAACQQRVRVARGHFDTSLCRPEPGNGGYRIRFEPPGSKATDVFEAIADPPRRWARDPCGWLSLDHTGKRAVAGGKEKLSACWGGR